MEEFLQTWRNWAETEEASSSDQSLLDDKPRLDKLTGARRVVRWSSWDECREQFDPWCESSPLHTGLVPLPFVGDVRRAKVYFLLLNPGLSANDYYAEYEAKGFRQRLLANLRQDFTETEYPFYPLDPDCAWHSGNEYWEGKLKHIALQLCQRSSLPHSQVRKFLAQSVCAIEMLPYHSVSLDVPWGAMKKFSSVALARRCVKALMPRAQAGGCMLVVMRRVTHWEVNVDCEHVVRFSGGQSRGAHLGIKNDDSTGARVVDFLLPHLTPELMAA